MRTGTTFVLITLATLCVVSACATAQPVPPDIGDLTGQGGQEPTAPPFPGDDGGLGTGDLLGSPSFAVGLGAGMAAAAALGWLMFSGGAKFVTSENVLDNETRYEIYEYLRRHAGSHLREIAATLQLSTTNALWHLRKLEEADLIRAQKVEGYKVFYPVDEGVEGKKRALANAALKKDNAKAILEWVAHNPGSHQREMARAIHVNHGTIRWHLRKMVNAGLLIQIKREHATLYYLTELGGHIQHPAPHEATPPATPPSAEPPQPPAWAGPAGPGVAEA